MKINASKILFTLFGVFIIVYLGVTVFNYFYSPFVTEMAVQASVNDTIDVDAIAIRDEKTVKSNNGGVAVYSVENGGKVAKGAPIIDYYTSNEAAALKKQIDELTDKVVRLSTINTQNSNYAADLELVSANVTSDLFTLLNCVDSDDFSNADEYNNELYYSLCQSGVTTGTIKNITDKIKELESELSLLKSKYTQSSSTVYSDYAGYFVNTADGYENSVDYQNISKLTANDYDKIKAAAVDKSVAGKVICDTSWYLLAKISSTQSLELSEGKSVKIIIPAVGNKKLSAVVTALNTDSSGKVLCILNCTNMSNELAMLRNQKIQIVVNTYSGLRVNKKAVRVNDGKKGVYVSIGGSDKWREVDIIYSGDEFVIVDSDNSDGKLKIYDDVIIKGKGLD